MIQFDLYLRLLHAMSLFPVKQAQANERVCACRLGQLLFRRIGLKILDKDYFVNGILKTNFSELEEVISDISSFYSCFKLPKATGSRTIEAINKGTILFKMQKNLYKNFLIKIPLPAPVKGFVPGECYIAFLSPHIGRKYFLRLDIKNFFGSITKEMVANTFQEYLQNPDILEYFVEICTLNNHLPQGAVTSPAVSNVIFTRVDQRILKYCQAFDIVYNGIERLPEDISYTRYADDMLFSSNYFDFSKNYYFVGMINNILKSCHFAINVEKTKMGTDQIVLTGHVLGDDIHLSRKKLYSINKILFYFSKEQEYSGKKYRINKSIFCNPNWISEINALNIKDGRNNLKLFSSPYEFLDFLCGYRSMFISIVKGNLLHTKSKEQLRNKVKKIEMIIDCILKKQGYS